MSIDWREPYRLYRQEAGRLLDELARDPQLSALRFANAWLADALTALQIAVGDRLTGRDGCGGRPLCSSDELLEAVNGTRLPDGRRVRVTADQLEQLLALPALVGDRLGPLSAIAARVVGRAERRLGMVPITSIYPVVRTVEFDDIGRTGTNSHLLAFVGAGHHNDGVGLMLKTCIECEQEDPSALDRYVQVDVRLVQLAAIREMLMASSGHDVLVLLRGERRYADEAEGTGTAEEVWCAGQQPGYGKAVEHHLPDAVTLGEVSPAWLRDRTFSLDGGLRRIGTLSSFFSAVERRDPTIGAWTLRMTARAREQEIAGADDVVVSDLCVIGPDDERYALVMPVSQAETTVYTIPYGRAERLGDDGWDVIRVGLAAVHGAAVARSSDDQGRALVLPRSRALGLSDRDGDRAANLDSLRTFSHAIEVGSHWLRGGPSPHRPHSGEHQERKAA